jgi:DNA-binding transcriptional LysR family regulator
MVQLLDGPKVIVRRRKDIGVGRKETLRYCKNVTHHGSGGGRMRWDDVPLFLAIARGKGLTKAAETLGLNHATVYRRLASLEDAVETRLFDRDRSGYALTAAGEAMLPHAERVETDMLGLQRAVVGQDLDPEGIVRVTAPESLLELVVPVLSGFRERWPRIELRVTFSDRFFDLSRREADVAIRPSPHPPQDAVGRRIASVGWSVYMPKDCEEPPEMLPWATYSEDMARLGAVQWRKAHHGWEPVLLAVNTTTAMQQVIACSRSRGLLPCFLGDPDPRLRRLMPPILEAQSELWVLTHQDLKRTARVRVLLDALYDGLGELVPELEGTGRQA